MSKKFTILVIPDDDSETSSYSFSKIFIKIAIVYIQLKSSQYTACSTIMLKEMPITGSILDGYQL